MNESHLLVRLIGELPPSTDLSNVLGEVPDIDRRRGMPSLRRHGKPQEVDVWAVTLIERNAWIGQVPDKHALDQATDRLHRMAPGLASLDRRGFKTELRVSTIQDQDQGGFEIPADVIALAGEARLDLVVSILYIGGSDDDDSGEENDPRGPSLETVATAPAREREVP